MSAHQVPPGTYLQPVPDHCDRITWRGQCLSLEHIVGASKSDASQLLSQLKVVQFHMIRGDFDGNERLQGEAIARIQETIDAAAKNEPLTGHAADKLAQAAVGVLAEFGTASDGLHELYQALAALDAPIDMVPHCPECGRQHIDEPERSLGPGNTERLDWDNPPHRSHLCGGCGHIWRPADVPTNGVPTNGVPTNGVVAMTTKGKDDSPPVVVLEPGEPTDSQLLDFLDGQPGGHWIARDSTTGRGYRVHQSSEGPHDTARSAIRAAMLEAQR